MKFKAGTTIDRAGEWRGADGLPLPFAPSESLRCQIRDDGGDLACEIVATIDPDQTTNPGKFRLSAVPSVTAALAPGHYLADLVVEDLGGARRASATFDVEILARVTQ